MGIVTYVETTEEFMKETIAGISVHDTALVREATGLVMDAADEAVYHHSRRVYFWGMLQMQARGWEVDPELAYVGWLFHDLGLTKKFGTADQRFEVYGADLAYEFLREHGRTKNEARNAGWASPCTPPRGSPNILAPEGLCK